MIEFSLTRVDCCPPRIGAAIGQEAGTEVISRCAASSRWSSAFPFHLDHVNRASFDQVGGCFTSERSTVRRGIAAFWLTTTRLWSNTVDCRSARPKTRPTAMGPQGCRTAIR